MTDIEQTADAPDEKPSLWRRLWAALPHPVRWVGVLIAGVTLMAAGIAMLVLPGPGIVFILLGLAVLASEFAWAAVILDRAKETGGNVWSAVKSKVGKTSNAGTTDVTHVTDESAEEGSSHQQP